MGYPFQFYIIPGYIWVDYPDRQPYAQNPGYKWIERPEHAIFSWVAGHRSLQGFDWVRVLSAMVQLQFELYGQIFTTLGDVIVIFGISYSRLFWAIRSVTPSQVFLDNTPQQPWVSR